MITVDLDPKDTPFLVTNKKPGLGSEGERLSWSAAGPFDDKVFQAVFGGEIPGIHTPIRKSSQDLILPGEMRNAVRSPAFWPGQ